MIQIKGPYHAHNEASQINEARYVDVAVGGMDGLSGLGYIVIMIALIVMAFGYDGGHLQN